MNPAQAMGTFLKTWRADWAGLSRRQVAVAVSGLLNGSKQVSPTIIREWEDGQPPKTSEEFEALCQVMGRNHLTPTEVEQFRRAVLIACAGRQYPELFQQEGLAYRSDVHDVAHRLEVHTYWDPPGTTSIVHLVACLAECETALHTDSRYASNAKHRRRLAEAIAWLRRALEVQHGRAGRNNVAADLAAVNAACVAETFGEAGLGHPLTVFQLQTLVPIGRVLAAHLNGPATPEQTAPHVRRLRQLYEKGYARGECEPAIFCLYMAAGPAAGKESDWIYTECLRRYDETRDCPGLGPSGAADHHLFWASWTEGRIPNAEVLMERMSGARDQLGWAYYNCLSHWETIVGSADEAHRAREQARRCALEVGSWFGAKLMDASRAPSPEKRGRARRGYRRIAHLRTFPRP